MLDLATLTALDQARAAPGLSHSEARMRAGGKDHGLSGPLDHHECPMGGVHTPATDFTMAEQNAA
jgi:hypothetical protein